MRQRRQRELTAAAAVIEDREVLRRRHVAERELDHVGEVPGVPESGLAVPVQPERLSIASPHEHVARRVRKEQQHAAVPASGGVLEHLQAIVVTHLAEVGAIAARSRASPAPKELTSVEVDMTNGTFRDPSRVTVRERTGARSGTRERTPIPGAAAGVSTLRGTSGCRRRRALRPGARRHTSPNTAPRWDK